MQNVAQNQIENPFIQPPIGGSGGLLSWEVVEKPIFANNQPVRGYKALFRSDNGGLLNVTKASYTPTKNERFLEVVDRMSTITGFPIKCHDEFEGGRKVLAFLECNEPIKVQGYDFQDFMLIGNSHDSSTGFFIGNSSKMIRCSNRFSKMFRQLQVSHTKNHDAKIDQLLRYFETYQKERKHLFNQMQRMAEVEIDASISEALVQRLARMNEEERLGTAEMSSRKLNVVHDLWKSIDKETLALGDNLFGLFNGVTHYTTHVRKAKETTFGNALGTLARINQDAFQFCESYL
jgi:hypothetical protein